MSHCTPHQQELEQTTDIEELDELERVESMLTSNDGNDRELVLSGEYLYDDDHDNDIDEDDDDVVISNDDEDIRSSEEVEEIN